MLNTQESGRQLPQNPSLTIRVSPVVLMGCLLSACDNTNVRIKNILDTSETGLDTAYVIDTDDTADTAEAECPDRGQKFYVWQLGGIYDYPESLRELADSIGMTNGIITTSPEYIEWLLDNFREAGLKFTPQLASWADYTTDDNRFDLAAWEAEIREYEDLDLQCYIEEGVFDGVLLLDDLGNFYNEPDLETLDYMAFVIKDVFKISDDQDFPIIVRHDPADLDVKDYAPTDLNTIYSQMTRIKASEDLATWYEEQIDIADELGLQMIGGVNLLDWDVAGEYEGTIDGRYVITPDDLGQAADVIASGGCNSGVGGWKLDGTNWAINTYAGYEESLSYFATAAD